MDTKSSVVKSKSSNSTKTNRSENHDQHKKTRSNVEFQPNLLKKRGVYVEKKHTNMAIDETAENQAEVRPIKAPPRPRAGNKKFLTSILTILSKSTTGTQYPDIDDTVTKKKMKRRAVRNNRNNVENKADDEKVVKRKTKYKSKALNDEVEKEVNQERVVVLQSQKEMVQTPSVYSENDSYPWSNLPMLVKNGQQNQELIEKNVQEVSNELAKEIMEGQKIRKDKRVRIDERNTHDSNNTKQLINNETITNAKNEKDKGLYNFFVDFLEATISVYNLKAEYDQAPTAQSEPSSVKIPLEIDEVVAKKLDVWPKPQKTEEAAQPKNSFYCLTDLDDVQKRKCPPRRSFKKQPRNKKKNNNKKFVAESFSFLKNNNNKKHVAESFSFLKNNNNKKYVAESFSFLRKPTKTKIRNENVVETRKYTRREKKKTLINLFKEQLRMDENEFQEPQNFYEALKVIAENKHKCQKTIHFENSVLRNKKDFDFPECMFKRRKVISPSTKLTKNKNARPIYTPSVSGRYSEISSKKKRKQGYVPDNDSSCHSLEVYGMDFIKPTPKKKELFFTYHSTPSSVSELRSDEALGLTESDLFCNDYYDF